MAHSVHRTPSPEEYDAAYDDPRADEKALLRRERASQHISGPPPKSDEESQDD